MGSNAHMLPKKHQHRRPEVFTLSQKKGLKEERQLDLGTAKHLTPKVQMSSDLKTCKTEFDVNKSSKVHNGGFELICNLV